MAKFRVVNEGGVVLFHLRAPWPLKADEKAKRMLKKRGVGVSGLKIQAFHRVFGWTPPYRTARPV